MSFINAINQQAAMVAAQQQQQQAHPSMNNPFGLSIQSNEMAGASQAVLAQIMGERANAMDQRNALGKKN